MERVSTAYHQPRNLIPMNWKTAGTVWQGGNGGVNPFPTTATDPNTNAFTKEQATGRSGIDGNMTVAFTTGFTPNLTVTIWEFNPAASLSGTPSGSWIKIGPNNGNYQVTVDATYTMMSFQVPENSYILVTTSAAVTGNCYTDAIVSDFANQSFPGIPEEGQ